MGASERLVILDAAADDLLNRTYAMRQQLQHTDLTPQIPDKVAKQLVAKFPDDTLKETVAGYDIYAREAESIISDWGSLHLLIDHLAEFREHALQLISQASPD